MATIALYKAQINRMPEMISEVKQTVTDYKSQLAALKKKTLTINQSICNLQDVISSIQASSQIQEKKEDSIDTFKRSSEDFVEDVVRIDTDVAEVINKRKEDFYSKYSYLKPVCERSVGEKATDWAKKHWKALATVAIITFAVILICTGVGGIIGAMAVGALFGAGVGGVVGGVISAIGGGSFWEGFENGVFSGAIAGIISGGMGFGLSGGGKVLLSLGKTLSIGGVSGMGTSLLSDIGDIFFKGSKMSLGQVFSNMLISATVGALLAGAGYGISKTMSLLFKNSTWLSQSKELFRIGKTANPNYGKITGYTTKSTHGASINFANRLGNCMIRFEFDLVHSLHYHMPAIFATKAHIPLMPSITSILSGNIFTNMWNKEQL